MSVPQLPPSLQSELQDICDGLSTPQKHCDVYTALDSAYNGVQNSVYKGDVAACMKASTPGRVDYEGIDICMCKYSDQSFSKADFNTCIADHTARHAAVKSALTSNGVPVVDPILARLRAQLCTPSDMNPDFNPPLTCDVYTRSLGLQPGTPDYVSVYTQCMMKTNPTQNKIMKNCICSEDPSGKILSPSDLTVCVARHQPGVPVNSSTSPGDWEGDVMAWLKNNMVAISIGAGVLLLLLLLLLMR